MAGRRPRPVPEAKERSDSWAACLSDEQRWQLYDAFRKGSPWYAVAEQASAMGAQRPGRTAVYNWAVGMRAAESAHRLREAVLAREEAGRLVAAETDDETLIAAFKTMAQSLALSGSPEEALAFTTMALKLSDAKVRRGDLALKERRQATAEEGLRLAREKFEAAERRLAAAKETVGDTRLSDDEKLRRMKEIFG